MPKNEPERVLRITDRGAVIAVTETTHTLIQIWTILRVRRIPDVQALVDDLREQLTRYLDWLNRVPDGTLLTIGVTREQLANIKKSAQEVLKWKEIPSEEEYSALEKRLRRFERKQRQRKQPAKRRIPIMTDTSFLVSYLTKSEPNASSTRMVAAYLKDQRPHWDLYLPTLVLLEVISKLKQKYPFKRARSEFDRLVDDIAENRVALNDAKIDLLHIFERYDRFAKNRLSSRLRSNDFIIATDGILTGAIILTCDRKMYDVVRKTYRDIFCINEESRSYIQFINRFEQRKTLLSLDAAPPDSAK